MKRRFLTILAFIEFIVAVFIYILVLFKNSDSSYYSMISNSKYELLWMVIMVSLSMYTLYQIIKKEDK